MLQRTMGGTVTVVGVTRRIVKDKTQSMVPGLLGN